MRALTPEAGRLPIALGPEMLNSLRPPSPTLLVRSVFALCGVLGLSVFSILPLAWREQAILGGILVAGAILLSNLSRSQLVTLMLMAISVFSTVRYGYWRVLQTWDGLVTVGDFRRWDTIAVLLLLSAEFYAFVTLFLGYFQTIRPLNRRPVSLPNDPRLWPTVDVLIPTYNEPLTVVRATVLAALAMEYPKDKLRVFVLDDGRRAEFHEFANQVGAGYITRDNNVHAKAGNINHALQRTHGEYVAIFDSDHIPTRSFLQATLGWFLRDRALALVQTPHHFYSPDPFERNLGLFRNIPNESELFHRVVQDGNDLWNASFFCGSCAVMRRRALNQIGGIAAETVTEDAHTALRLQRSGWSTAYINIPQAAGLATESLASHIGQRIRWARGMVQILRIENPLFASGLNLPQRLCYFNASTHFLHAVPRLIFLTIPVAYLLFGMVNIYGYSLAVIAYAFPHIVLSNITTSRVQGRHRFSFWSEVYEAVLAPYILLPTLLALINPRLGKFKVTSKGGILRRSYFDRRIALPFLLLLILNAVALSMAVQRFRLDPAHRDTVVINVIWTIYNLAILSVAASVAWERRQRRSQVRLDVQMPFNLVTSDGRQSAGLTTQLSPRGVALRLASPLRLARGSAVRFRFQGRNSICDILALVASSSGRVLRLFFPQITLAQEQELTSVLYTRPAAWLSWRRLRPVDSPLRSLLEILWLGLRGLFIVLTTFFTARPKSVSSEASTKRGKREPAVAASILFGGALLVLSPHLLATTVVDTLNSLPQPAFHEEYELGAITGRHATTLRGSGSSQQFFFDMPITKVVDRASLQLRYSTSSLLRPSELSLELTLNGTQVGSLPVTPGTNLQSEIVLPTDLLITENTVILQLHGQCVECRRSQLPWVTIQAGSTLTLSGTRLPIANDLSLLPAPFFDRAAQRPWSLAMALPEEPDHMTLQAASVVASWFGIFSDVRGVSFLVTLGDLPQGNAVVFALGTSPLAQQLALPRMAGALIAMRDNPRDPYGKLLVLSGQTTADLLSAARSLATRRGFPHADVAYVHDAHLSPQLPYEAARWLPTDKPALIGTYTTDERLRLQGSGAIDIYFRLPPDLYLKWRQAVPLRLKYTYAGVVPGSRAGISIRLNGEDVGNISLPPASQQTERTDIVELPTGKLQPYTNTLTVDIYFGGDRPPGNVRQYAAVHRDSSLDLREIPHSVVLPRLELFADAGFPFTEWPDLAQAAVVMPEAPTRAAYEELLDVAAFFGAQTGSPGTAITVTDIAHLERCRDKNLLLLGNAASQPLLSRWSSFMPLQATSEGWQLNPEPTPSRVLHSQWPFREHDRQNLLGLLQSADPLDLVVEGFVSPYRRDRSVVALVPRDGNNSEAVASMFIPIAHQGPIYGGVAVAQNHRFQSFLVGTLAYRTGNLTPFEKFAIALFEGYWLIPGFVAISAFTIGTWAHHTTERIAARRLAVREI